MRYTVGVEKFYSYMIASPRKEVISCATMFASMLLAARNHGKPEPYMFITSSIVRVGFRSVPISAILVVVFPNVTTVCVKFGNYPKPLTHLQVKI